MAGANTPFPPASVPPIGPDGQFSRVWLDLFVALFRRTGGSDGADLSAILTLLNQLTDGQKEQGSEIDELNAQAAALVALPLIANLTRRLDSMEARHTLPVLLRGKETVQETVWTHGIQDQGDLHALASATSAGFMSAADKAKLDSVGAYGDPNDWAQVAKTSLPTAAAGNKGWRRFVTNATGATGIVPVYSDGTAWKRFSDDSVVN